MTAEGPAAEAELDRFLARFTPAVEASARAALARMRACVPGATELVYDNYNALAIAFGANDKRSGILFSIAVSPRWVSLFFSRGPELPDPHGLLKGEGTTVRHIVLSEPDLIDTPPVRALIAEGLERATPPVDPAQPRRLIIKSVAAKQRSRRPG